MKALITVLAFCMLSSSVFAGGISVGTTRVIYNSAERESSFQVSNSDKKDIYLVQSWVTDASGKKTKQFIITPPLFKSNPGNKNQLRVIFRGKPLPKDRESVFWVNVKSIPAINSDAMHKNTLQLAIKTVIKLFYRPDGLNVKSADAPLLVAWKTTNNGIKAHNTSPYYITVSSFYNGKKLLGAVKGHMIPPFSEYVFKGKNMANKGHVIFKIVNDYGGLSTIDYDLSRKKAQHVQL